MQILRAGPGRGSWRENLVETREIVLAQPDIDRPDIFFQMTARLVAWNWKDVVALRQQPGQSELRWSRSFFLGKSFELPQEFQVAC